MPNQPLYCVAISFFLTALWTGSGKGHLVYWFTGLDWNLQIWQLEPRPDLEIGNWKLDSKLTERVNPRQERILPQFISQSKERTLAPIPPIPQIGILICLDAKDVGTAIYCHLNYYLVNVAI